MRGTGPPRRGQPLRAPVGRGAVGLAAVGLAAVAAVRLSGTSRHPWLVGAQAVARWALVPAPLLLPVSLARRWPGAAALLTGATAYQLALTRSARGRARPDPARPGRTPVRLVSANLLLSNLTIDAAVRTLGAAPVDVLALQELTPEHLAGLRGSELLGELPHAVTRAQPGFHGAGLFSRWPLSAVEVVDLDGVPLPVATVEHPDGRLRVAVVHATNPGAAAGGLGRWRRQLRRLAALVAASAVPVVLVGDFNATADHRDFRRLLGAGLRDAWDVAGRGSGASWPVWHRMLPPLLRLDHALVGEGVAVLAAAAHDTPGSDHRHLRVELQLVGT